MKHVMTVALVAAAMLTAPLGTRALTRTSRTLVPTSAQVGAR